MAQRSRPLSDLFSELDAEHPDGDLANALADARHRSEILRRLVNERQRRKLTQRDVAKAMETTQSAVAELEGGATDPRLSTLQRYGRAIGLRVRVNVEDELADRKDQEERLNVAGLLARRSCEQHATENMAQMVRAVIQIARHDDSSRLQWGSTQLSDVSTEVFRLVPGGRDEPVSMSFVVQHK